MFTNFKKHHRNLKRGKSNEKSLLLFSHAVLSMITLDARHQQTPLRQLPRTNGMALTSFRLGIYACLDVCMNTKPKNQEKHTFSIDSRTITPRVSKYIVSQKNIQVVFCCFFRRKSKPGITKRLDSAKMKR